MRPFPSLRLHLPAAAWALFAGTFVNRVGSFVLVFLVLYLTRRGYSVTQAGMAMSVYGMGSMTAALVGGTLADRLGRRNSIALSMFTSAGSMLALSQARTLPLIVALTGLAGLTAELYRPAAAALLADVTPLGDRRAAFSLYRLAVNLGFAIGPATAGLLTQRSFLLLFVGDAITSVIYGVVALAALPHGVRTHRELEATGGAWSVMRRDRALLSLIAASVLLAFVDHQSHSTLPLHIVASGHTAATYGLLMSFNAAMVIALELSLTLVTRRYPARRMIAVGIAFYAVGYGLTAFARSITALAATVAIWTMGEMIFSPVSSAYVADLAPAHMRGRYQSALSLALASGLVLAPALGTRLFAVSPALVWGVCFVVGAAAAGIIIGVPDRVADHAQVAAAD